MRVLAGLLGCALAGCSDEAAHSIEPIACAAGPIVNGRPGATLVRLSSAETLAIAAVLVHAGNSQPDICSGVLVASRAVLTAKHCFTDPELDARNSGRLATPNASVVFGNPSDPSSPRILVDAVRAHPELDVALLELAEPAPVVAGAASIPLLFVELEESWVGAPVELAGYGASESAGAGTLAFAVERIARLEEAHLVVDGNGKTGACIGDSGGPMLASGDDGRVYVIGVLAGGATSCTGEDYYTRIDDLVDWTPLVGVAGNWSRPCAQ